MAAQRDDNIRKYRKPLNINIGMIIFVVVFIYIVYGVMSYFQTKHIVRYEVKEGSLAVNNVYRGIILRDEQIVNTNSAGYINYFAYEGERVAVGDLVYTLDEAGKLNSYLESADYGVTSLSDKELREFRSEIVNYVHGFDERQFSTIYDFKHSVKNSVLKLASANMLNKIQSMQSDGISGNAINYAYASGTGIVSYWLDGYETLTADNVTKDVFEQKEYDRRQIVSSELVAVGDPAYKLSANENWSIVIPVEKERGQELVDEGYIKVRFLGNQYESWGKTKLHHNADGESYLELIFNNSMVTFAQERYLDIELILHDEVGLKIPLSAIVEKEFFLIDEEFVFQQNEDGEFGVNRQGYKEDGTTTIEFVPTEIYSFDEKNKEYYLDASLLSAGDILHKADGMETYVVSRRATLIGVYNMNKGYADFKEINILYQNDEYAIVKANTRYGLNVYDYIVLEADAVRDNQFINEK